MSDEVSPAEWCARAYVKSGMSIEQARDLVIMRCLEAGDATAFSYFVLAGHQPGAEVMKAMAFMTAAVAPAQIEPVLPFRLLSKRRSPGKAGPRPDPLVAMRDELFEVNIRALMDKDGITREAATAAVAEMVTDRADMVDGRSRKFETVRKARKRA